jgi:hypothetical protein
MPSKLSIHLSGYPDKAFDVLERIQPSIVKVFNQPSEMSIDELRRRCGAIIIYREFVDLDFRTSADVFYSRIENSLNKLRGRGIIWEGLNEPVVNSVDDAKAINAWFVRFAQIMHSEGELVAGFSWSTGNPMPDKLYQVAPYLVEAAAATDVHAFHEYYTRWVKGQDWGRYRDFEQAMPAYARKPVIITEAGLDETGQWDGGYLGRISVDEYIDILKQYDQVLLQDPYVLGATIFQWGDDSGWRSFDLSPAINALSDYMLSVGRGAIIPRPWPVPVFGPARTFTATPSKIQKGQKATLDWNIEGASTASLDGEQVSFSGSRIVEPAVTTTYVLHIVSADGTTQDLTVIVIVETSVVPIITDVSFTPTTLRAGQLLNVSITIQNNTNDTLATQGPNSGFVYDEGDTFRTRGFPEVTGAFRVGVDFDGRSGVDHPYRWGLGAPLAPEQTATIVGSIRLKNPQSVKYWVGLVREQVQWLQDDQGTQLVTVKPAPSVAAQITQVTFTPTTLNAAQVLKVSITVQNNSEDALPTQGPGPGFVYEEGDTFYTRGFPDTDGAFRVGVD